jgi:hypothetical protein
MEELYKDIKTLVLRHKWIIVYVIVFAYFVIDWKDVKQGLIDGWLNK